MLTNAELYVGLKADALREPIVPTFLQSRASRELRNKVKHRKLICKVFQIIFGQVLAFFEHSERQHVSHVPLEILRQCVEVRRLHEK